MEEETREHNGVEYTLKQYPNGMWYVMSGNGGYGVAETREDAIALAEFAIDDDDD